MNLRVKRNGESIQVIENGVYIGSVPVKELCQYVRQRKANRHSTPNGTESYEGKKDQNTANGTENNNDTKRQGLTSK